VSVAAAVQEAPDPDERDETGATTRRVSAASSAESPPIRVQAIPAIAAIEKPPKSHMPPGSQIAKSEDMESAEGTPRSRSQLVARAPNRPAASMMAVSVTIAPASSPLAPDLAAASARRKRSPPGTSSGHRRRSRSIRCREPASCVSVTSVSHLTRVPHGALRATEFTFFSK